MSKTIATLFSGGEGIGVGARAAGLQHIWGIEHDDRIAQVARDNGFAVITADVRVSDPDDLQRPDVLHASPPCPNFSQAKTGAVESDYDIVLARQVARFIDVLRPLVFTLENVYRYRTSESWSVIRDTLYRCGYWFDLAHVNAADFQVPQTRKRMLVRAVRGQMVPYLPLPESWCGWYDVIKDLIPRLPRSHFAKWQIERLPDELLRTVLLSQGISRDHKGGEYPITVREKEEPAFTVTANSNMNGMRALLIGGQYNRPSSCTDRSPQVARDDQPSFTVTASYKGDWRACRRSGQVVRMNVRALARFQSFPDDYVLPDSSTLAGRVIGNAVPPMLYEKIVTQLLRNV